MVISSRQPNISYKQAETALTTPGIVEPGTAQLSPVTEAFFDGSP
jgi:hypothetical protein